MPETGVIDFLYTGRNDYGFEVRSVSKGVLAQFNYAIGNFI